MSQDSTYAPKSLKYASKGLIARNVTDATPADVYLDFLNCFEREENSVSSRYGTTIITRDPDGTANGQNYFFDSPVTTLAKLNYSGQAFRYAGVGNQLFRRAANTQGQYSVLTLPTGAPLLSGQPFQTVVTNCFETSQPYLFIYDGLGSIKDTGVGNPSLTGLDPTPQTAGTAPYSPLLTLIDNFASGNSYTTSGFSVAWAFASITTITATGGAGPTDFPTFTNVSNSHVTVDAFGGIVDGMLAVIGTTDPPPITVDSATTQTPVAGVFTRLLISTTTPHGLTAGSLCAYYGSSSDILDGYYTVLSTPTPTQILIAYSSTIQLTASEGILTGGLARPSTCVLANHYSKPYPTQFSAWGFYQAVPTSQTSFPFGSWGGTVAQNTTVDSPALVGRTVNLDLSYNNQVTDDDLIIITLNVGTPAAIDNIRLQFDVNGSGYSASYYYKDISPAYYQSGVSNLQTAYTTVSQQVFADTLGLLTGAPPNSTVAQLQPGSLSTGPGAWVTVYLRRGDFVPVGNANTPGVDWSSITGWQLVITTNTVGSSTIAVNGLYLQWGYGPSSFGGVGYDYRYTPYNANTGTEGNGSPEQAYSQQFGYLASLAAPIFLSQAAQITGSYFSDPQVTHIRIYRRGGTFSDTWRQLDQILNLPTAGSFVYKDVIADANLAQASPLVLDNDPPVTSSLRKPIQTFLAAGTSAPPSSIYAQFLPQLILVAPTAVTFVPGQVVDVGTPASLEQVRVITGGTGQFTAILRLQHNAGEPVNVYAVPRQPCSLAALAYGQVWLAGDSNNPHYLYFSKVGRPENFGPQNYIPVGSPKYPIMIVVNWRGTLFVATTETWWIIQGGAQPTAQPTGSIHGAVSSQGWCQTESAIWYQASDGWREMRGADGGYMTLPVEFLFRQTADTPVPLVDPSQLGSVVMAFYNNTVFGSYVSLRNGGQRYRLAFDTNYQRYRYDDVGATALLWEQDTNQLLAAVPAPSAFPDQYMIVEDFVTSRDSDDGGWQDGALAQTPIQIAIQTPYQDLGAPHAPKQFNVLEVDANTKGQQLTTSLLFKTEPDTSLVLANSATTTRQKVQLQVAAGAGYQAYSASIRHTMGVTVAPTLYQENIYAAVLAAYRSSFDTYWIKFGSDESKIIKQAYFDYNTTQPITVSLYADGDMTLPYFQFTLPAQADRASVRVLFPAWKPRLWRAIGVCTGQYQFWSAVMVEHRPVSEGSTWARYEVLTGGAG